jgi:hypothetical protein
MGEQKMIEYIPSNTHQSVSLWSQSQHVARTEERPDSQLVTTRKYKGGSDWCPTETYMVKKQQPMNCF